MPNPVINVDPSDMAAYFVHGNTNFTTSETEAQVRVRRDADDDLFEITIDGQWMNRKDIKELRAFLKQLLQDQKKDPDDEALK